MDLRTYLDSLPLGGVKDFATKCAISTVYLLQLAARQDGRQASPTLCNVIVRESGGLVTLDALRPDDWDAIWPDKAKKPRKPSEHASANRGSDRQSNYRER
jgi:DNA-binding transcriptional regulator YdaS (Cro superfamily)